MTYLCVLVWAGERVWSQWQVLKWEVSQEGQQWERMEKQELEGGKRYVKQVPIKNNSKLCLTIPTPFNYVVNTDMHTAMRQVNTCKKCCMYLCVLEWAGKWVWSEYLE